MVVVYYGGCGCWIGLGYWYVCFGLRVRFIFGLFLPDVVVLFAYRYPVLVESFDDILVQFGYFMGCVRGGVICHRGDSL